MRPLPHSVGRCVVTAADVVQAGMAVVKGALVVVEVIASLAAVVLVVGGCLLVRAVRRVRLADQEPAPGRDVWDEDRERWTDTPVPPLPRRITPPIVDTRPGIDLNARDTCERLYNLPARHPGLDRLRQAIRDQQQKEADDA